ncbi:hypothetical protein NDU88_007934 [Pleurodeles waltl]|uniref:Uncharacterized protein n=1 Tax=Pleurodeles waltl TaxID=8319 RepID=A0AAV7NYT9_PLEWA|nr:hypothetical protein NDU88_007934 [Pleurodeles waltl]
MFTRASEGAGLLCSPRLWQPPPPPTTHPPEPQRELLIAPSRFHPGGEVESISQQRGEAAGRVRTGADEWPRHPVESAGSRAGAWLPGGGGHRQDG